MSLPVSNMCIPVYRISTKTRSVGRSLLVLAHLCHLLLVCVLDGRSGLGDHALASLKALTVPIIKRPFAGGVAVAFNMLLMTLDDESVDGNVAV